MDINEYGGFTMNANEFVEIKDKAIKYNGYDYSIYEIINNDPETNIISIEGKTLRQQRDEDGYVVEALRINENRFKCEIIWLTIEGMGWSEAGIVTDDTEMLFVQNILKECGIELVF